MFTTNSKKVFSIRGLLTGIAFFWATGASVFAQKPVIIEFGWDYPDVNELSKKLDSIQNTPFDGICFSYQRRIMEAFDTMAYPNSHFEFDKLKTLKWGKYTENYSILRGYSKTGGNWFNDDAWRNIEKNMNNLSKAMFTGKLKGILFDPEYYLDNPLFNPWTYSKKQYPDYTFGEVKDQVRKRGSQFVKALQKHTVNFNFLSIWITSLLVEDMKLGPIENARHVMLLPFVEGMLLGKNEKVKIIDGNEYGYWNIKPSQFLESNAYLKNKTIELMQSARAKQLAKNIETAQPVYYDGLLARHPSYNKGVVDSARWKWLEENLKFAIAASTSNIVWFYNERVNWWSERVNDTLINILQKSKTGFIPEKSNPVASRAKPLQPKTYNINTGNGYYYFIDSRTPMKTGDVAFTYKWNVATKVLSLKYKDKLPEYVDVYINSVLVISGKPISSSQSLKLKAAKSGRLVILAKYKGYLEACGLEQY